MKSFCFFSETKDYILNNKRYVQGLMQLQINKNNDGKINHASEIHFESLCTNHKIYLGSTKEAKEDKPRKSQA